MPAIRPIASRIAEHINRRSKRNELKHVVMVIVETMNLDAPNSLKKGRDLTALKTTTDRMTADKAALEAVAEVAADATMDRATMKVNRLMASSRPTSNAAP